MLTIAGGILLAIFGLFFLLFVVSMVAELFTRKHPYSPPTSLGSEPSAEELRRKYGVDPPNHC
jgi:hypothetical protein